jgi:hypothetical protein
MIAHAMADSMLIFRGGEYLIGFENTYKLTFYVALVAVVIGLFMPGWPAAWAGRAAAGEAPAPAAH